MLRHRVGCAGSNLRSARKYRAKWHTSGYSCFPLDERPQDWRLRPRPLPTAQRRRTLHRTGSGRTAIWPPATPSAPPSPAPSSSSPPSHLARVIARTEALVGRGQMTSRVRSGSGLGTSAGPRGSPAGRPTMAATGHEEVADGAASMGAAQRRDGRPRGREPAERLGWQRDPCANSRWFVCKPDSRTAEPGGPPACSDFARIPPRSSPREPGNSSLGAQVGENSPLNHVGPGRTTGPHVRLLLLRGCGSSLGCSGSGPTRRRGQRAVLSARVGAASRGVGMPAAAGGTLGLWWNTLSGSHTSLRAARRRYFSAP